MSGEPKFERPISGLSSLSRMKAPATPAPPIDVPAPPAEPVVEAATSDAGAAPDAAPAASAPVRPAERRTAPRTPSRSSGGKKTPQKGAQRSAAADAPKEQLGTRVSRDVGQRARATFRATGYLEGEMSFAEFVENALLREVERRERDLNHGEPFPSVGDRLPAGPPLRS